MIALETSAVGNVIVKVLLLEDLSDPKSNTATAGFVPPDLYINAPLAVIVELVQDTSPKSTNAVAPELDVVAVIVLPPASYPVPETSLVVAYAVVVSSSVASDVNKAILNVCDVSELKSISPSNKASLKDVHI
tara:strand:- start:137 stop:535 length:399 start_codon:yes stop_codon:yes gene_type:complete